MSARLTLPRIRASSASLSAEVILPFSTLRARMPPIVLRPLSTNSCRTSFMMTVSPLAAATWAMPLPIWPEPMTPKVLTCIFPPMDSVRF